jgi:D-aminoacyl-tRNA deacylase
MRALVQRVSSATVTVGDETVGSIAAGLCAFIGVSHLDDMTIAERMASRLWTLRIFADEDGLTNRSAADLQLEVLVVSQFTLYADTSRGRRPSFVQAALPGTAEPLVEVVAATLRALGAGVATGRFGASMQVTLVNDGPFTLMLDSDDRRQASNRAFPTRAP